MDKLFIFVVMCSLMVQAKEFTDDKISFVVPRYYKLFKKKELEKATGKSRPIFAMMSARSKSSVISLSYSDDEAGFGSEDLYRSNRAFRYYNVRKEVKKYNNRKWYVVSYGFENKVSGYENKLYKVVQFSSSYKQGSITVYVNFKKERDFEKLFPQVEELLKSVVVKADILKVRAELLND